MNKNILLTIAIGSLSSLCCGMNNYQQQQAHANSIFAYRYMSNGQPVPAHLLYNVDPLTLRNAQEHNQKLILAQQQQKQQQNK